MLHIQKSIRYYEYIVLHLHTWFKQQFYQVIPPIPYIFLTQNIVRKVIFMRLFFQLGLQMRHIIIIWNIKQPQS